jgi:uncharacterized protein (DUF302 family)
MILMHYGPYKTITHTSIIREDITTGLSYETLVAAFERELGRWDPVIENTLIKEKAPWEKVEKAFQRMAGPHGLMIFFHVDQGRLTSLQNGIKKCVLYLVGNGVVAEPILTNDIRASLYVPFRVCLYDNGNPSGAIIAYDRPSSFLATLNNPALYPYGRLLDSRMDCVVHCILNNRK